MRLFVSFLILSILTGAPSASAAPKPKYQLQITKNEARDTLNQIVENLRLRKAALGANDFNPEDPMLPSLVRLHRAYRFAGKKALIPIKEAPFLSLVVNEKMGLVYEGMYDQLYIEKFDEVVRQLTLETIYDGFLEQILTKRLPKDPEIQKAAKQIGECMAKRALKARGGSCPLDLSEKIDEPGWTSKAWAKTGCSLRIPAPSACYTRRVIFNTAKSKLIAFRKDPKFRAIVEEEFNKEFPQKFRDEFLLEIGRKIGDFPKLVAGKFAGGLTPRVDELWGASAPLIETDENDPGSQAAVIRLDQFIAGTRADLMMASLTARMKDQVSRGMAAALLYTSANRLLMVNGGVEAYWNGSGYDVATGPKIDPRNPKKAPLFATNFFGGWGAELGQTGVFFAPWDFANYNPVANAGQFRLIPAEFAIDSRGVPATIVGSEPFQRMEDLAELIEAMLDYLDETRPGAYLSRHFGAIDSASILLDTRNPLLLPPELRKLAVGILAASLGNLIAPGHGHLSRVEPGTGGAELGIVFHDRVTLRGRENRGAPVRSVAKLLIAASRLRRMMDRRDPDMPPELLAVSGDLDTALQAGAMWLGGKGQEQDGGFRERLGESMRSGRTLANTILGIRAISKAYEATQVPVMRLRIKTAFQFMDRLWGRGVVPRLLEAGGQQIASPSTLWMVLNFWDEFKGTAVFRDLGGEMNMRYWNGRFEALRRVLQDQLQAPVGPGNVGT